MSISSPDLLKLGLVCAAFMALALLWVYQFKLDDVAWTLKTVTSVCARVVFVEAAVIVVVCYGCGFSVDGMLKLIPFIVIGFLISNRNIEFVVPPVDGGIVIAALFSAILVTCVLPFYVIKQFLIGFPDRKHIDRLTEPPDPYSPTNPVEEVPSGTAGVVSSTLRPLGKVEIDGKTFDARHVGSSFVDAVTPIIVCGQQRGVLLVKESDAG